MTHLRVIVQSRALLLRVLFYLFLHIIFLFCFFISVTLGSYSDVIAPFVQPKSRL
jgi:hypothetical protein